MTNAPVLLSEKCVLDLGHQMERRTDRRVAGWLKSVPQFEAQPIKSERTVRRIRFAEKVETRTF
eukprot:CAMPEP_0113678840 /NCGR_PEP_ID=MMETSP0038_2-20120614/10214_1 /TAXON_ID=2898 /ORGANISM="Cryptomonas paramecium" /LENGTH=63 /DNA_ID=CAMNT_0000596609 /DNA_START=34 /DNA_END=225 /DNA_ORIENTATION=+ /assembly_acc=CAM_ASM_000170